MRILVVGGSKGVGRHIVKQALAAGHEVTLMARRPRSEPPTGLDEVAIVAGDATEPQPIHDTVAGQDAVIIAVGGGLSDRSTRSIVTANVLGGMTHHQVERIVIVSSIGAGDSLERVGWGTKLLTKTLLRNAIKDHNAQETSLQASDRKWTIVRPGALTDAVTGYRTVDTPADALAAGERVGRAQVAEVVLESLQRDDWIGRAVHVLGA